MTAPEPAGIADIADIDPVLNRSRQEFGDHLAAELVATLTAAGGEVIGIDGTTWWAEAIDGQPAHLALDQADRKVTVRLNVEVLDTTPVNYS